MYIHYSKKINKTNFSFFSRSQKTKTKKISKNQFTLVLFLTIEQHQDVAVCMCRICRVHTRSKVIRQQHIVKCQFVTRHSELAGLLLSGEEAN